MYTFRFNIDDCLVFDEKYSIPKFFSSLDLINHRLGGIGHSNPRFLYMIKSHNKKSTNRQQHKSNNVHMTYQNCSGLSRVQRHQQTNRKAKQWEFHF